MAKSRGPIERLEATDAGYSQSDLASILQHYGYEFVRNARHGAVYKHPELTSHPNDTVRRNFARVMIPVGRDLPRYAARSVRNSVQVLLKYRRETHG